MRALWTAVLCLGVATHVFSQNIQMNTPDHNTGTLDNSTIQSETNHATNASVVVAGWNDTNQFATLGAGGWQSFIGYGYMNLGSAAFVDAGVFNPVAGWQHTSDPAVASDSAGNIYICSLASNSTTGDQAMAVGRSTGTTAPIAFGTPVLIPPASAVDALDKEFLAVDNSGSAFSGRVYVVGSEGNFITVAQVIVANSTTTTPLAFTAFQFLTPADAIYHGAMAAAGPSGELYVVYGRYTFSFGTVTAESIQVRKSTDGGATFAPAVTIATPTPAPSSLAGSSGPIRTRDFPFIAVDNSPVGSPTRGNVYVVFQAHGPGTDNANVFFTRSTNGGSTWSAPRAISNAPSVTIGADTGTNDNWMPSIAVSPVNGHIGVTFYDRREDPANNQIRLYRAFSSDGGLVWSNAAFSSTAFSPGVGFDPLAASSYMGDYNWASADATSFHTTWGDCRNACAPGAGANPCSPGGRADQDAFYRTTANLSGPDMFIQPWGFVTGVGPTWQTPDIFVVDASNAIINAAKGVHNNLRARVRNIGDATATNAIVRFKYAPWFAGITDAALKDVGPPVTVTLGALGSATDTQIVPIDWDLTDLTDTNGGLWPSPISAFSHFCMKVSIELPSDVNLANNAAQNNFVNVMSPPVLRFALMVGNPDRERPREVRLVTNKLPEGFGVRAYLTAGAEKGTSKAVLKPGEIRMAEVELRKASGYKGKRPVIADVSLRVGDQIVGGVSAMLYSPTKWKTPSKEDILPSWSSKPGPVSVVREEPPAGGPPTPPPTESEVMDPAKVKLRGVSRTFRVPSETAFRAALAVIKERGEAVALADPVKGLINTRSVDLSAAEMARFVVDEDLTRSRAREGRYVFSFYIRQKDDAVEVTASTTIVTRNLMDSFLGGRLVRSNGSIERAHLDLLERLLR